MSDHHTHGGGATGCQEGQQGLSVFVYVCLTTTLMEVVLQAVRRGNKVRLSVYVCLTTTLMEVVLQAVRRGYKVCLCVYVCLTSTLMEVVLQAVRRGYKVCLSVYVCLTTTLMEVVLQAVRRGNKVCLSVYMYVWCYRLSGGATRSVCLCICMSDHHTHGGGATGSQEGQQGLSVCVYVCLVLQAVRRGNKVCLSVYMYV